MSLTDTAIRGIKPADKARKFFDGNGLFRYFSRTGNTREVAGQIYRESVATCWN